MVRAGFLEVAIWVVVSLTMWVTKIELFPGYNIGAVLAEWHGSDYYSGESEK
jgi:hypothetical protein